MTSMSNDEIYIVPPQLEGVRLDKVLAELLPNSGLRLRRRLCDEGTVLVDGQKHKPGYKVRPGQEIAIKEDEKNMTYEQLGLSVVRQSGLFAAVFKPGGIHSAHIIGKDTPCAEAALPELFPGSTPILLNRLDCLTSGLLLVALSVDGERIYREQEEAGEIKKFYLAQIQGRLDGVVTIKTELDTDDRKTTRVLDELETDERRWTDVDVIAHDHENNTTLVRCLIMKGARHQIRAHLASIGHPIVGDPLYGEGASGDTMFLHHQRVEFPGFSADSKAPWSREG